jgi:hypothetical protein
MGAIQMKLSLLTAALLLTVGCSSSGGAAPDDFAQPSDENDITKARSFTCDGDSGWMIDGALTIKGTGKAALLTIKSDFGTHVAKFDPSYPNARTKPQNVDFRKFSWKEDNDPWTESGSSVIFVHKDMLDGKAGVMKYQATGEVFTNEINHCSPKK